MSFNLKEKTKNGQPQHAPRILFVGVEGVGKSTIGNRFPDPIFICGENGLVGPEFANTANVSPDNWEEVMNTLRALYKDEHDYKTVVLDTVDWLEPLVFNHICTKDGKTNVEAYGYGKGYIVAADEWRHLLVGLENLRTKKNMNIVILSHCHIKSFNNPAGDNYDKYEMKVCKQIAGLTKEWCDAVLFARFDVYTYKEGSNAKAKAVGSTERVVYTSGSAAWDAKNRYGLPEKLALDYDVINEAIISGGKDAIVGVRESIETLLKESESMTDERKEMARKALKRDSKDIVKLRTLLNKIKASA